MPETVIQDKAKEAAGRAAAERVQSGMLLGIGTGSTVAYFIARLGERCKEGLKIQAVATSNHTATLAKSIGIPLLEKGTDRLDLAVDGADEIDKKKRMIKGGGGALLREKIVTAMTDQMIVIVDKKKCVENLGAFPLPLEISCFCHHATLRHLEKAGFHPIMRKTADGDLFLTDNGNFIADMHFKNLIESPEKLNIQLLCIPGVLETGLFLNFEPIVLIGHPDGKTTTME